ncbi:NAD dependent epimerase/dehydratase family protein, partial [Yersinia pestis PY-03]
MQHWILRQ